MDALTTPPGPDELLSPFAIVGFILFGLVFIAAAFYASKPWSAPFGKPYSRRFVQRNAAILGWISGAGLFFLIIRILGINPASFGEPIWPLLCLVALIAAIVWIVIKQSSDRKSKQEHQRRTRAARPKRRTVRRPI